MFQPQFDVMELSRFICEDDRFPMSVYYSDPQEVTDYHSHDFVELVLILSGDRRMVMDDAASRRLTLRKGRHVITGSVINGPGMSDFCLRFIHEDGTPVLDYVVLKK